MDRTCKTCKWWSDCATKAHCFEPEEGFGFCDGIPYDNGFTDKNTIMYFSADEGVYAIETRSDFGCILWEEKEKRQNE